MTENALFSLRLKISTVNNTTKTAIVFLSFICQNISIRALRISQIVFFPRQELANEHTLSFVRQFSLIYGYRDLNIGIADLSGAGGTKIKRRIAIFGQRVSGMTGHLIFACQLARPKKCFIGHPSVHNGRFFSHMIQQSPSHFSKLFFSGSGAPTAIRNLFREKSWDCLWNFALPKYSLKGKFNSQYFSLTLPP